MVVTAVASMVFAQNFGCVLICLTDCLSVVAFSAVNEGCLLSGSATFTLPGRYSQVNWKRDNLSAQRICLGESTAFEAKNVFGL